MLGALLGIRAQLLGERHVLGGGRPALAGAGDRARLDAAPLGPHQALRAARDQRDRPEVEVAQVGAGVDRPERPVDRERVHAQVGRQALAGHHLEDVAGMDVAHRLRDRVAEGLGREVAREVHALPGPVARHAGERAAQALERRVDEGLRPGAIGVVADDRGGDDEGLAPQVVEHHDHLGLDEAQVRDPQLVGVRVGQALVEPHQVVGRVPDDAAPEGRQERMRLGRAHRALPQHAQRVAGRQGLAPPPFGDGQAIAARLEAPARAGAEERVARDALPLLHGLEQERRLAGDLQVRGERGVEVGEHLAEHGLQRGGAGLSGVRVGHGSSFGGRTCDGSGPLRGGARRAGDRADERPRTTPSQDRNARERRHAGRYHERRVRLIGPRPRRLRPRRPRSGAGTSRWRGSRRRRRRSRR